jgi:sec-independent protein translocase protein TatB
MFDIGWSELAVIAVVALVVIGPKDLPRALKTVGIWVRKARSVSREFQGHIDQMIREAELDELRQQVEKVRNVDLEKEFEKTIDPTGGLAESLKPGEIPDLKSELSAAAATPAPAAPLPEAAPSPPVEAAAPAEALPSPAPAAEEKPDAGAVAVKTGANV